MRARLSWALLGLLVALLVTVVPASALELAQVDVPPLNAGLITMIGAVAFYTRLIIDLIRVQTTVPLWGVILMLLLGGPCIALLLWFATDPKNGLPQLTVNALAGIVLAGWAGAGGAVGSNSAAAKAMPTKPPSMEAAQPGAV